MVMEQRTCQDWVEQVQRRQLSVAEGVEHCLQRLDQSQALGALVNQTDPEGVESQRRVADAARVRAEQVQARLDAGETFPLAGLPIVVKDCIATEGLVTTAGSRILERFVPVENATCVERLQEAGAIVVGKANMDEFAMGSSNENSAFGVAKNPFDLERVPGGSSGGSAASVAGRMVPVALGSDTGGSIRQPAAFCGITGLKPTYGRVSRNGLIAYASSLDQIGPLTTTAADCGLVLSAMAGHDPRDSTCSREPVPNFLADLDKSVADLTIGYCPQWLEGIDAAVVDAIRESLQVFRDLGAELVEVELPHAAEAVATYYVIASCEASSNLSRYDGVRYSRREPAEDLEQLYTDSRGAGFGAEVQRRILLGTFALSSGYYDAYYLKASRVRRLIRQEFEQAFQQVDLLVGPTTPTPAFRLGSHRRDPVSMYLADVFTVSANLAGIPALSCPCGLTEDGLPIGLQLQGRPFEEATLLRVAHQFQQATQWHRIRPNATLEEA